MTRHVFLITYFDQFLGIQAYHTYSAMLLENVLCILCRLETLFPIEVPSILKICLFCSYKKNYKKESTSGKFATFSYIITTNFVTLTYFFYYNHYIIYYFRCFGVPHTSLD